MSDETRKIVNLVGTSAQFSSGGGRKGLAGHDTELGSWKCQLDASGNFAVYARRDAAQTFTGLQSFSAGVRDFTLTQGRVVTVGAGGRFVDSASLTYDGALFSVPGLKNGAAAGTGTRPKVALADGTDAAQDAATFRGTIGAVASVDAVVKNPTSGQIIVGQHLTVERAGTSYRAFGASITGNSLPSWEVQANGIQSWGDGLVYDTNLYRSAANTLKTDDNLEVGGFIANNSVIIQSLAASKMVATDANKKLVSLDAATVRSTIDAASSSHTHTVANLSNLGANWSGLLTSAKPTTLAGYGVTNAVNVFPVDTFMTIPGNGTDGFITEANYGDHRTAGAGSGTIFFRNGTGIAFASMDADYRVLFRNTSGSYWHFGDCNMTLNSGKSYCVNEVPVIGTRKTGWTTATGTATRTTFATSTVTTAQLAERVKALIDDLISHGLIGA